MSTCPRSVRAFQESQGGRDEVDHGVTSRRRIRAEVLSNRIGQHLRFGAQIGGNDVQASNVAFVATVCKHMIA